MTAFTVGNPITTRVSQITVDGNLPPGRHVFTLVVRDDAGNSSAAAAAIVVVAKGRFQPDPGPLPPIDPPTGFRATEPKLVTRPDLRVIPKP